MLSSQASLNAVAQLVMQQLQHRMSPALQKLSPIALQVNSPLAVGPTTPMQNADTPLSRENSFNSMTVNAPLSRNNSDSSGSNISAINNDDNAADLPASDIDMTSFSCNFEQHYDNIRALSRATGKRLYKPKDKVAMNDLVMAKVDALLLAPLQSNMFRHKRKVGSDEFRKHPEIEFNYFKKIIRSVIREACANDTSNEPFLPQRYFWCAYDLVRKRRANHIQYWRRYGRPKHLIYGGKALYEATYGKLHPIVRTRKKKKRAVKQELFNKSKKIKLEDGADENVRANYTTNGGAGVDMTNGGGGVDMTNGYGGVDMTNGYAGVDMTNGGAGVDMTNGGAGVDMTNGGAGVDDDEEYDPFSDKFSDELCKELLYETRKCKRCKCDFDFNTATFDPDGKDEENLLCGRCLRLDEKCKCCDCGATIKRGEAFPQNSIEWTSCPTVRCGECWEKHIKKVLPAIAEKHNSKKKQKNQSKCKKCGSTTHKTARSRWCPFNPKYNQFLQGNNYFHFPLPNIPGEGVGGYFDPLTAPPSITTGGKATDNVIRRPVTPPPAPRKVDQGPKAPPPIPSKAEQRTKKVSKALKIAPLVDHEDVGSVEVPFTGRPPPKTVPQKKATFAALRCYTVGSNVFAMFKKKQWFLAHVTARDGVKHDVYFPGDSQVMSGLTPNRLRPCPASCTAPTRREMIGKEFEYTGDEEIPAGTVWKVRRVNKQDNSFRCTKLRGGGRTNCDDFDIGYVMSTYREQQEKTRENGPKASRKLKL